MSTNRNNKLPNRNPVNFQTIRSDDSLAGYILRITGWVCNRNRSANRFPKPVSYSFQPVREFLIIVN